MLSCRKERLKFWIRRRYEILLKGKKSKQTDTGLSEAFYRFFSVVYDEQVLKSKEMRKIYPVTVKLW